MYLNVKTFFKVYIMTHGLKKYNNEILKANFKGSLYTIGMFAVTSQLGLVGREATTVTPF